jgi:beta-lactam-binding protein with PASTA domain
MKAGTALGKLEDAGLEAQVDSQYVPALPAGTVLRQEPRGLARVKPGRPVYLVVNKSQPPDVKMPDILETNVSQATYMLQNWDLQVGEIHYITGRAKNEVQRAEVNGTDVQPGDPVVSGSEVDLYVSRGLGKGKVALPDLTGLKLASAKAIMEQLSLQLGFLRYDSTAYYPDSMIGRVVLQDPKATGIDSVREGIEVSLMVAGTPADVEDQDIDPSEIPPAPETEGSPGAGLPGEESGLPEDFD